MHLYVYPKVFFQRLRIYTMSFQILARCNSIFNQLPSGISKLSFEMFLQFTMGFSIQPLSRHTGVARTKLYTAGGVLELGQPLVLQFSGQNLGFLGQGLMSR